MKNRNVLISSGGRRGQLVRSFQRTLVDENLDGQVFVAEASEYAPAAYLADGWFRVPRVESAGFINEILRLCDENSIGLVIPTIDTELEIFSQYANAFRDLGTTVVVSAAETIRIAGDKMLTNHWLVQNEFLAPRRWSNGELGSGIDPNCLPIICKPARGSRSRDVEVIRENADITRLARRNDVVIEDWIDGDEYTVSTYVDSTGKCLSAVPRKRLEIRDGEVSKGVTESFPEIQALASSIVERLPGAYGPLNIQIIREKLTDRLFVIEINARFGGGDPLAWEAGANSPKWLVQEYQGRDLQIGPWESGLMMLRFDQAVYLSVDQDNVRIN
ncbi:MAG: hypothetical protein JW384_03351 [Nitrosomonadaceae bacterium]|nr:hypothetical protein [Nitrosomonadaceae bacterium]